MTAAARDNEELQARVALLQGTVVALERCVVLGAGWGEAVSVMCVLRAAELLRCLHAS